MTFPLTCPVKIPKHPHFWNVSSAFNMNHHHLTRQVNVCHHDSAKCRFVGHNLSLYQHVGSECAQDEWIKQHKASSFVVDQCSGKRLVQVTAGQIFQIPGNEGSLFLFCNFATEKGTCFCHHFKKLWNSACKILISNSTWFASLMCLVEYKNTILTF